MASNFPGPYEVDYTILVSIAGVALEHHLRVNCVALGSPVPGTPLDTINFQTRSGGTVVASTAIGTLWGFLRTKFNTVVTVTDVKLWRYTPGTYAKTFISALASTLPAGLNAAAIQPAHQTTYSFRSGAGGVMKITLLEDVGAHRNKQVLTANAAGSDDQKIAAYVISSASWLLARDDGFPIAPIFNTGGENEAVFKQRFR